MTTLFRGLACMTALLAGSLVTVAGPQTQQEPTQSGPAQSDPSKKTGKSTKKATKGDSIPVDANQTGQQHRPANSAVITKNGQESKENKGKKGKASQHTGQEPTSGASGTSKQ